MKYLLFLMALLLVLSACNIREDALLPPDLSAADYLTGNKINTYANYLVKSANDDSYLLVDKNAIADSLINYGDEIVFRKVPNFASRDSLALQNGAQPRTNTYEYSVKRAGQTIELSSANPLGTVYTELTGNNANLFMVNFSYYLQASPIQPATYGSHRAYFPVTQTGEFCLYSLPEQDNPELQHSGTAALHALMLDSSGNQLAVNFPASYCIAAGTINLGMSPGLEQTDQSNLQNFFPNAAISTPIIELHTGSATGTEVAVLRLSTPSKGYFGKLWTRLTTNYAYTWPAIFPDATTENWWQENNRLYSFITNSGKYFLLSPLDTQNEVIIPLDGSYSQVFLQDLWFDINGLSLANTSMKLKLNPNTTTLVSDYFNANPFTITGSHQAFEISFWEGSAPLASLPNDAWIEFGFRSSLSATANDRLFRIYRDSHEDLLTYKTSSDTYDATHYSRIGNYVYLGISSSATYLYGSITDSATKQNIAWHKAKQYLQTANSIVSWDDSTKRSYSSLSLDLDPAIPVHPWLQGEPLSVSNTHGLANFSFYQGTSPTSTLPANFSLSLPYVTEPDNVVLFNNASYPRIKNYVPGTTFTGDSFVAADNRIVIYPEFPGTIFSATVSYTNPMALRAFSTMTFVFGDLRIYTYGTAPESASAVFNITRSNALTDPYQILANQYSLSQTSPVYTVNTNDDANYANFQPMLFFKRNTRDQNLLIYENNGDYYRLYPYNQSDSFDPYAFMIDGGYNGISLAYSGSYASYTDSNPHNTVHVPVTTATRDAVLSLYQAQLVLPAFFIGPTIPLASTLRLDKLSALPGVPNLLTAYQLQMNNSSGQALAPDFYNVVGATQMPYVYLPVSQISSLATARMFYRNTLGQTTELTRVQTFGDNFANEFIVVGNSFICTVKNPGLFYITGQ
jgi:hypothetical protein